MIKNYNYVALALISFALVVGCDDDAPPIPATPPPSTAKKSALPDVRVPSILEQQKDSYVYNPAGKRDPFKAVESETTYKDLNQPQSPLERYNLNEMQLTGIIWGVAEPRALVKIPDGQSYIVRTNSRIGKNRGRVAKVTRREVYVEEEYRDPTGKVVIRESKFELRKPKVEEENLQLKEAEAVN